MYKDAVYRHYKSFKAIAEALGITKSAVSQWPKVVPEGAAYKLQALTRGKLKVNARLYLRVAA